ncbi:hypothetical protein ACIBEJ_10255 [Nonomuraea sp. NPDC050790]|uniref:hypothetical protein n=1 Tax=Nonomuraea sp. NPDC050790 TaxID=3364371 RepID=UPI003798CC7B
MSEMLSIYEWFLLILGLIILCIQLLLTASLFGDPDDEPRQRALEAEQALGEISRETQDAIIREMLRRTAQNRRDE